MCGSSSSRLPHNSPQAAGSLLVQPRAHPTRKLEILLSLESLLELIIRIIIIIIVIISSRNLKIHRFCLWVQVGEHVSYMLCERLT